MICQTTQLKIVYLLWRAITIQSLHADFQLLSHRYHKNINYSNDTKP